MSILTLAELALAPSIAVLAAGTVLAVVRIGRDRRNERRRARRAGGASDPAKATA